MQSLIILGTWHVSRSIAFSIIAVLLHIGVLWQWRRLIDIGFYKATPPQDSTEPGRKWKRHYITSFVIRPQDGSYLRKIARIGWISIRLSPDLTAGSAVAKARA